ncbi:MULTISPECIES: hypothetical protein [Citrobacter freundii complex]
MRKSYGVTLSPMSKLCNSVERLTNEFRTVISVDRFNNSDC